MGPEFLAGQLSLLLTPKERTLHNLAERAWMTSAGVPRCLEESQHHFQTWPLNFARCLLDRRSHVVA